MLQGFASWGRLVLVLLAPLGLVDCAHRHPLPRAYAGTDTAGLLARLTAAQSRLHSFSAEARVSYFGPEGRLRGSVTLLVARPDRLRYELMGPHGGPLMAVATDGQQVQVVDFRESRFVQGPATASNLDRLLDLAPLGLPPAGWVALLFGEVTPPPTALLGYDDAQGAFLLHWQEANRRYTVAVDPVSAQPRRATIRTGPDNEILSDVEILARDAAGLPTALQVTVPSAQIDMGVRLRDVLPDPPVDAAAFTLQPPRGVTVERL